MTIKDLYPTSRPSLDLNFARTKRLDPRVTFSRASTGTYFDANGVLQSAATNVARFDHNPSTGESLGLLMEEARTNNLNYSQYIHLSPAWSSIATLQVPNADVAPDQSITATALIPSTANASHYVYKTISVSGSRIYSLYVKEDGYSYVGLSVNGSSATAAWFNLSTLQSSLVGASVVNNSIVDAGGGWRRIAISTSVAISDVYIYVAPSAGWGNTTGDGVSGVLAWGAQLESGNSYTTYIPTPATFTSRASTATYYDASGVIQTAGIDVARSAAYFPDSNGVMKPAGLLLEAAGTNLLNGSQTFATSGGTQNNWVDTNITRDGTLRTSPDGTANALRVTAAAANATLISSAAIGTSAQRTFSIFLRRVTGTGNIDYTLDNGATWTTQVITTSWTRYSFPATTADQQVGIRIATSGDAIELWGAQLEASSYSTSYVATTTATVTRSADVSSSATVTRTADVAQITGTNFSSWYRQDEGTVLVKGVTLNPATYADNPGPFTFTDSVNSSYANRIGLMHDMGAYSKLVIMSWGTTGSSSDIRFTGIAEPAQYTPYSFAVALKDLDNAVASGGIVESKTNSYAADYNPSLIARLGIAQSTYTAAGNYNGTISRLTYYPTRLTNTQLQALTAS